ncbi:MAG: nucleotidyltransferase domain-containing protein [Anaerolineales bacterium]|nr:MAG: nucleotidyltransferase domain-containing protein [Anaerolineales bacterium]
MSTEQGRSQRLQAIVETIVQVARPERVILFGSRAKGTARGESDYDFLVVVRGIRNGREVSRRIYRALLDRKVGAAVDVVVVDAGTLEQHRESPFYIYRQALQEGRVFYDHGRV